MTLYPLQTRTWQDKTGRIEERQFTTESAALISLHMDQLIKHLYHIGELTAVSDVNSIDLLRAKFPKILFHRIDVHDVNPLQYKVLEYDQKTRMDNFQDYTGLVLGQWENTIAREAITLAYSATVMTGLPRLALTTKTTDTDSRSYLHLTWPLREEGEVTQVLVAACYEDLIITASESDRIVQSSPDKKSLPEISSRREILSSIKAKFSMAMPIHAKSKSIAMEIRKIMANREINTLIY